MWTVIGVLASVVVSVAVYKWWRAWDLSTQGESGETKDSLAYQYQCRSGKSDQYWFGIRVSPEFNFTLKRENRIDKFFKWIGSSVEIQTGNAEFDDLVYIVSDNQHLQKLISSNDALMNSIIEIFKYNKGVCGVSYKSGVLRVDLTTKDSITVSEVADYLVPRLTRINETIASYPEKSFIAGNHTKVNLQKVNALLGGVCIYGMIQLIPLTFIDRYELVDSIFLTAITIGGAVSALIVLLVLLWNKRSSNTHMVLLSILFFGSVGVTLTAYSLIYDLNVEFDPSRGKAYQAPLVKKEISKSARSRTRYYLYVEDWNQETTDLVSISVSSSLYDELEAGDQVLINQRDGLLSFRWVDMVKKHE